MHDSSRCIDLDLIFLIKKTQNFRSNKKYQIYSQIHKDGDMTSNIETEVIVSFFF